MQILVVRLGMLAGLLVIGLAGCCTPEIRYVDKVVYQEVTMPDVRDTGLPDVKLEVWGDYLEYKVKCEAQIAKCNADKQAVREALDVHK